MVSTFRYHMFHLSPPEIMTIALIARQQLYDGALISEVLRDAFAPRCLELCALRLRLRYFTFYFH